MAKTLVEEKICKACGADVRPNSLFCYNCGGAVSVKAEKNEASKNNHRTDANDALPAGDVSENADSKTADIDLKTTKLKKETIEDFELKREAEPIKKPSGDLIIEKIEEKPAPNSSTQDEAKLKSAASLRRKAKIYKKKTVEVVWEEPETAPNKWFPIVAIVLILMVVGIFYLAMYLK